MDSNSIYKESDYKYARPTNKFCVKSSFLKKRHFYFYLKINCCFNRCNDSKNVVRLNIQMKNAMLNSHNRNKGLERCFFSFRLIIMTHEWCHFHGMYFVSLVKSSLMNGIPIGRLFMHSFNTRRGFVRTFRHSVQSISLSSMM